MVSVNYQPGRIWNGLGGEPPAIPGGDYLGKCCGKPHRNCGQWIIHGNSKLSTSQHSLLSFTGCKCNGTSCFELLLPCTLQSWARIIHPFSFRLLLTDFFVCFFNPTTRKETKTVVKNLPSALKVQVIFITQEEALPSHIPYEMSESCTEEAYRA